MRLFSFDNSENESFNNSKALEVFKCKLYYVYYGRNAWHSTWITKYTEGCVSTSLKTAKNYVEWKRVQGSVFYISEIPAIAFKSSKGYLFITEINTSELLKGYSPFSSKRENLLGEPKIQEGNGLNQKFKNLATSFDPYSDNWVARTRYRNSVLILGSTEKEIELESYSKRNSYRYQSHPNGYLHHFIYSQEKHDKGDKFIDEIVKECNKSQSKISNRIALYKCLNSKANLLNEDDLLKAVNEFFNFIKKIKSPSKDQVWINDCNDILGSKGFDDINIFLSRNGLNAVKKQFHLSDFLTNPYKKVVVYIHYPLSALKLLMEINMYEALRFFEHLKLILIRLKLKSKMHEKVVLSFYDKFMNCRIFVFSLNYSKEDLFYSLEQLHETLTDSFEIYEEAVKRDDYSVQIYHNNELGFKFQNQRSFIDLFTIKHEYV